MKIFQLLIDRPSHVHAKHIIQLNLISAQTRSVPQKVCNEMVSARHEE